MIPLTIQEEIDAGNAEVLSHRMLTNSVVVKYNKSDERIRIPMDSLISKYSHLLDKYVIDLEIDDDDRMAFAYSPKKLSYYYYGTTQFWSLLLYLNDCHSLFEFSLEKEKVSILDPANIQMLLNEILILERKV